MALRGGALRAGGRDACRGGSSSTGRPRRSSREASWDTLALDLSSSRRIAAASATALGLGATPTDATVVAALRRDPAGRHPMRVARRGRRGGRRCGDPGARPPRAWTSCCWRRMPRWRSRRAAPTRASSTRASTRCPASSRRASSIARWRCARTSLDALGVPVLRCGAEMRQHPTSSSNGRASTGSRSERASAGTLRVPGEWVTDPVAFTLALAAAAERAGAEVRTGFRVVGGGLADRLLERRRATRSGRTSSCNCAGLHADEVARLFGDDSFAIQPRKGEFLVFDVPLDRILLPVPSARTKGVLVFPTVHGGCVAGPTAIDREDKDDWTVRPAAQARDPGDGGRDAPGPRGSRAGRELCRPASGRARRELRHRPLRGRPSAGQRGAPSARTGLSAALGIAEHVAEHRRPGVHRGAAAPGSPAADRPALVAASRERPTRPAGSEP